MYFNKKYLHIYLLCREDTGNRKITKFSGAVAQASSLRTRSKQEEPE